MSKSNRLPKIPEKEKPQLFLSTEPFRSYRKEGDWAGTNTIKAFVEAIGNDEMRFVHDSNRFSMALQVINELGQVKTVPGVETIYKYINGRWGLLTGAIQFEWEGKKIHMVSFYHVDGYDGRDMERFFAVEELHHLAPFFDEVDRRSAPPERQCWLVGNDTRQDESMLELLEQYTWDDLVMEETLKNDLRTTCEAVFNETACKVFEKMGLPRKRGVILSGPPGNGKTLTGKVVAGAVGASLIYVTNTRQSSKSREKKPKEVFQEVFDLAHKLAPCVVILEELDGLLDADSRPTLLTLLDGLVPHDGVLTIATTNHLDKMDAAITKRPSRFDRIFEFGQPTADLSYAYLVRRFSQAYSEDGQDLSTVELPEKLLKEITDTVGRCSSLSFAALQEIVIGAASAVASDPQKCPAEALRNSSDIVSSNFGGDEPCK